MPSQNTQQWFDLSAYGVSLKIIEVSSGEKSREVLILADVGSEDGIFDRMGKALGFASHEIGGTKYWVYTGGTFTNRQIAHSLLDAGFNNIKPVTVASESIRTRLSLPAKPAPSPAPAPSAPARGNSLERRRVVARGRANNAPAQQRAETADVSVTSVQPQAPKSNTIEPQDATSQHANTTDMEVEVPQPVEMEMAEPAAVPPENSAVNAGSPESRSAAVLDDETKAAISTRHDEKPANISEQIQSPESRSHGKLVKLMLPMTQEQRSEASALVHRWKRTLDGEFYHWATLREVTSIPGYEGVRYLAGHQGEPTVTELQSLSSPAILERDFLRVAPERRIAALSEWALGEVEQGGEISLEALIARAGIISDTLEGGTLPREAILELATDAGHDVMRQIERRIRRASSDSHGRTLFDQAAIATKSALFRSSLIASPELAPTPVPLALSSHIMTLGESDPSGKRLTVINPGSGTLMARFPRSMNTAVYYSGISEPTDSAAEAKRLGLRNATSIKSGAPEVSDADVIIANLVSGPADIPHNFGEITLTRKELIELAALLMAKKDQTQVFATFISGASDPAVAAEYKAFNEWAGRFYAFQGIGTLSSELTTGATGGPASVVMSIGETRPNPLDEAPQASLRHNEMAGFAELWTWTVEGQVARRKIADFHRDLREGVDRSPDDQRQANEFQVPYVGMVEGAQSTAMAPKHLQDAYREAFQSVLKAHPDVAQWVADEAGWTVEHLRSVLAPEQIDAVALHLHAEASDKRGLLVADQTGRGKGRILGTLLWVHIRKGMKSIFMTQKAVSLRDMLKDMADVGVDVSQLRIKVLNNMDEVDIPAAPGRDAKIIPLESQEELCESLRERLPRYDDEGQPVFDELGNPLFDYHAKWPTVIDEDGDEVDVHLVMGTMSQVNRKVDNLDPNNPAETKMHAKHSFIRDIGGPDVFFALDECADAAGDSNTSDNVSRLIERAGSFVLSSATHMSDSNISIYANLFPNRYSAELLQKMIRRGGRNMQEVITTMLAREGLFIRREHDASALEVQYHSNPEHIAENEAMQDLLSPILSELAYITGDVNERITRLITAEERAIEEIRNQLNGDNAALIDRRAEAAFNRDLRNRRGAIKKLQSKKVNFGSPRNALKKAFNACLRAKTSYELCLDRLEAGRKPIFVVDRTYDTIMKEFYEAQIADPQDGGSRAPDFKDLFHRVVDQITHRYEKVNGEKVRVPIELDPAMEAALARVRTAIDALPDLTLCYTDMYIHLMESAGWSVGEMTGRKYRYDFASGRVEVRKAAPRAAVVDGYSNGTYDCLVINKSAMTAINLQHREQDADQRPRTTVFNESPAAIRDEIQGIGRTFRMDQISIPEFFYPLSGLPTEMHLAMVRQVAIEKSSANSTANRESAIAAKHVPDLLNSVGDEVCNRYANKRPELLRLLGLSTTAVEQQAERGAEQNVEGEEVLDQRSAHQLMSAIDCLPVERQKKVLEELYAEFTARKLELDALREDPTKPKELMGRATEVQRRLFEGAAIDGGITSSKFDEPVYVVTCTVEYETKPFTGDEIENMVMDANEAAGLYDADSVATQLEEKTRSLLQSFLDVRRLNDRYPTVEDAIAAENADILAERDRLAGLVSMIRNVRPGNTIVLPDENDVFDHAVILSVDYPKGRGWLEISSGYSFTYVFPGDGEPRTLTFASLESKRLSGSRNEAGELMITEGLNSARESDVEQIIERFDAAEDILHSKRLHLLVGNLFEAMNLAIDHKLGTMVVYRDATDGLMKRGVAVKDEKKLWAPVKLRDADMASAVLEQFAWETLKPDSRGEGKHLSISASLDRANNKRFSIKLPHENDKSWSFIYKNPYLNALKDEVRERQERSREAKVTAALNAGKPPPAPRRESIIINSSDSLFVRRAVEALYDAGVSLYSSPQTREWSHEWYADREYERNLGNIDDAEFIDVAELDTDPVRTAHVG